MAVKRAALRALSVAACSSTGSSGAMAASAVNVKRGCTGPLARSFSARSSGLVRQSLSHQQSPLLQSLMRGSTLGSFPCGSRGFASLPPHIKLDMPSLSPTMNQVCYIRPAHCTTVNCQIWLGVPRLRVVLYVLQSISDWLLSRLCACLLIIRQ